MKRETPEYNGTRDEILRLHIEREFERKIHLKKCDETEPRAMFRSCTEFFIICPVCKKQTKFYKHLYEAKQAWNEGETFWEEDERCQVDRPRAAKRQQDRE